MSEELNFHAGSSDEDIKDEIKHKLAGLLYALANDIVERELEFPIVINLECESENLSQRFKVFVTPLEDSY